MSTRQEALLTINSTMTQLMRRIRRVDDAQGIGRARLSALAVLHFGGNASLTELAQAEMVSRATMHHVVSGLESDDLVQRREDANDRRRQIITLTRAGRRAIRKAHRARIEFLESLAGEVDAADLVACARVLDVLRNKAAHVFPDPNAR